MSLSDWLAKLVGGSPQPALRIEMRRGRLGELGVLRCELEVPHERMGQVAAALGEAAGEAGVRLGLNVGVVGVCPGEEPVLVALAPRRDLLADRLARDLVAGEMHLRPHLWLALPAGVYLAQVVDPNEVCGEAEAWARGVIGRAGVSHAALAVAARAPYLSRVTLTLFAPLADLGWLIAAGRRPLARLSGWRRGREARAGRAGR